MEGNYLVKVKEDQSIKTPVYGAVNTGFEEASGKECKKNINANESSFETRVKNMSDSVKSCSCTVNFGDCDCGMKKKSINFEPWAPYKTKAMAFVLSLFGVWIIAITIIGHHGKL